MHVDEEPEEQGGDLFIWGKGCNFSLSSSEYECWWVERESEHGFKKGMVQNLMASLLFFVAGYLKWFTKNKQEKTVETEAEFQN